MSDTAFVAQAEHWAKHLVRREVRGPGDLERAMRRIGSRYGVAYSVLWALRYRKPKDIAVSAYFALKTAYRAECQRQKQALEHELEATREIAGPSHAAVRAAEALVGKTAPVDEAS